MSTVDENTPMFAMIGAASRWWLHHSLTVLAADLDALGASLTLRRGPAERVVMGVVDEVGAGAVHWNRRYGRARDVDARLKAALKERDIEAVSHAANVLFEPWTVQTGSGGPYGVFTPFWKSCLARDEPRAPLEAPASIRGLAVEGDDLDEWTLLPTAPDWAGGMRDEWTPGSAGGRERLDQLVDERLAEYHRRDEPGIEATSQLSPHLRFGEISPHQVWHRLRDGLSGLAAKNHAKFLSELGWREFSYHLLFHNPELATVNYRREFDAYPWNDPDEAGLALWQKGRTGIPIDQHDVSAVAPVTAVGARERLELLAAYRDAAVPAVPGAQVQSHPVDECRHGRPPRGSSPAMGAVGKTMTGRAEARPVISRVWSWVTRPRQR